MDFLTFISKIVESCAWPALIFFLLHRYRVVLLELISSLSSLKVGDYVNATFSREAAKVAEQIQDELPHEKDEQQLSLEDKLLGLPPRLAILDAWNLVENSLIKFIDDNEINHGSVNRITSGRRIPLKFISYLLENNYINSHQAEFFISLRKLRNEVVHGSSSIEPTKSDAENYVKSAVTFVNSLSNSNNLYNW
ncbi:hypothetical protein [Kosakonia cowanii]|uniref:hypothetical protein n=1 Tax=Kosakonia cowanii TaxID=208223 RepID=UPI00289FCBB4|nr:hypothetical protein [Kosakonia cowanii]